MITEEKSLPLRQVSQQIAKRTPFWVQGAGGNTSWKDGTHLWIKSSGKRLDQISQPLGLAGVHMEPARQEFQELRKLGDFETGYSQMIEKNRVKDSKLGRPSMETGFHLLLPRQWVFHFHALSSLLLDVEKDDAQVKQMMATSNLKFRFLDSFQPGFVLSEAVAKDPNYDVFVLKNHGIILHSETSDIVSKWSQFEIPFMRAKFGEEGLQFRDMGWLEIIDTLGTSKGPMKIYFPDTAVFMKDLKRILKPVGDEFELPDNAEGLAIEDVKARNLIEIWAATLVLHHLNSKLPEVPREISETVADLPTEKFRRGIQ